MPQRRAGFLQVHARQLTVESDGLHLPSAFGSRGLQLVREAGCPESPLDPKTRLAPWPLMNTMVSILRM
jgi:hypothetical protein